MGTQPMHQRHKGQDEGVVRFHRFNVERLFLHWDTKFWDGHKYNLVINKQRCTFVDPKCQWGQTRCSRHERYTKEIHRKISKENMPHAPSPLVQVTSSRDYKGGRTH